MIIVTITTLFKGTFKHFSALCRSIKVEGGLVLQGLGHVNLAPSTLIINKGTLGPKWRL